MADIPTRSIVSWILPALVAVLTAVIFVADTLTTLEMTFGVFYVVVVLMSVFFANRRGVLLIAGSCMALTVASDTFARGGEPQPAVVISLIAIAATTYLALKIQSAEVAAHEARGQLAHFSRVTALGELTASIAHEVNQPLAAIVTNSNACLLWLDRPEPNFLEARQAVQRIIRDANRASDVVTRVRRLARRAPLQQSLFALNDAATEVIALTRRQMQDHRIALRVQLADALPRIAGDRVQIQQVILNLIVNAIEAMDGVGEGPRELLVQTAPDDQKGVLLSVADTGPGLDPDKAAQIFEPFYTTKPEGMGMGLAISRSIVEFHGGQISAGPNKPRGTVFQLALPAGRRGG